jgi:hypothetical protein
MTSNPNSEQNMSAATKKLISRAKLLVPPMLEKFHKGKYRHTSREEEFTRLLLIQAQQVNWAV